MPKKTVLDTAGRALQDALKESHQLIQDCRVGKYIQLQINTDSEEKALSVAQKAAEYILCNSLIEDFELEVME